MTASRYALLLLALLPLAACKNDAPAPVTDTAATPAAAATPCGLAGAPCRQGPAYLPAALAALTAARRASR